MTEAQAKDVLALIIDSVEDLAIEKVSLRDLIARPAMVSAPSTPITLPELTTRPPELPEAVVTPTFKEENLSSAEVKPSGRASRRGMSIRKRDDRGRTPDDVILDMFANRKHRFIPVGDIRRELELSGFSPNNVYAVTKRLREANKIKRNNHNEFRLVTNHPADQTQTENA
jgi:hypothetical protein